jgi:hypothetical protein
MTDIVILKKQWKDKWPAVSGNDVINIFEKAALESWLGAEALIDAYLELEEKTGEAPSRTYVTEKLYFTLKGYWSEKLNPEQLNKLDRFLAKISQ